MIKNQNGNYLKIVILHLLLVLGQARIGIKLAQLSSDSNVPDQLPKVYHLQDNDMLQENMMSDNSVEVFRLRREHKKKKDRERRKAEKKNADHDKKPELRMQLQEQSNINIGIGISTKIGQDFVEVVSGLDKERAARGRLEDQVRDLKKKANFSKNSELNDATRAAIQYLEQQQDPKNSSLSQLSHPKPDWGIFTYFYRNGSIDHQRSESLESGQQFYRNRGRQDDAKIFVANGEVTRFKGDQVAIEILTGQALMDLNLKQKTFDDDKVYVVNHEANSIYNDITKFDKSKMSDAEKEYAKYPKEDATLILRGSDSQILKRKGEDKYIAQNMAYLYNDEQSQGKIHDWPFTADQLKPEE